MNIYIIYNFNFYTSKVVRSLLQTLSLQISLEFMIKAKNKGCLSLLLKRFKCLLGKQTTNDIPLQNLIHNSTSIRTHTKMYLF